MNVCLAADVVYDIAGFSLLSPTDIQGDNKLPARDDAQRR